MGDVQEAGNKAIFLVGASRSGTAMLRSALNQNPAVFLAGETHYFDDLRPRLLQRGPTRPETDGRRRCEDYFLALADGSYHVKGDPERDPAARAELRARAQAIGEGPDAYFEAYCRREAEAHGKARWGEKTPRHVFRIADMLSRYPWGQVVAMVRDPRAVVASYRDRPFSVSAEGGRADRDARLGEQARQRRSADPLVNSLLWRSSVVAARQAERRFGPARVRVQRYEDLIQEPEACLRELARWLGVDYDAGMLDVPLRNSSYGRSDARGVSTQPVQRWRKRLDAREVALVQSACGRVMTVEGYALEPVTASRMAVAREWLSLPFTMLRASAANRARSGSMAAYLWRRLRLAVRS